MESKRDQKRQSARKQNEYSVYSKKAVRAKEAASLKFGRTKSENLSGLSPKTSQSNSHKK